MNAGRAAGILLTILSLAACSGPSEPTNDLLAASADTVGARVENGRVLVANGLGVEVRFTLVERRWFETALAIWCLGGAGCGTSLRAGTTQAVSLSAIDGYGPQATEVLLLWWRPGSGEPDDAVRQQIVELGAPSDKLSFPVQLLLDGDRYAPGAIVGLTLVNRVGVSYAFNPCSRGVERETGGSWTMLSEHRLCTMEAWLLEPFGTRAARTQLPGQLEPGRYRLVIGLGREGGSSLQAPLESVRAVSAPFTVQ